MTLFGLAMTAALGVKSPSNFPSFPPPVAAFCRRRAVLFHGVWIQGGKAGPPQGPGSDTMKHVSRAPAQRTCVRLCAGGVDGDAGDGRAGRHARPGQTLCEAPDGVHASAAMRSTTKPARFLVLLVKDKSAPATVPGKVTNEYGRRPKGG